VDDEDEAGEEVEGSGRPSSSEEFLHVSRRPRSDKAGSAASAPRTSTATSDTTERAAMPMHDGSAAAASAHALAASWTEHFDDLLPPLLDTTHLESHLLQHDPLESGLLLAAGAGGQMCGGTALAGGAPEPEPEPFVYHSPLVSECWSLKLFGVTPDMLAPSVRHELEALAGVPASMEGFIRPGCVQLAVDMLVPREAAAERAAGGLHPLALRLLDGRLLAGGARAAPPALLQLGAQLAAARRGGRVAAVLQLHPGAAVLPRLEAVRPLAVTPGAATLTLTGDFLDAGVGVGGGGGGGGVEAFCRAAGTFVPLRAGGVEGGRGPAEARRAQRVALSAAALPVGCASIEVQANQLVSPPLAVLVAPSAEVVEEVRRLEADASAVPDVNTFLHELGLVLRHVEWAAGRAAAPPPAAAPAVAAVARRTAVAAAMFGWPALLRELLRAAAAGGGGGPGAADAAADLMDAMVAGRAASLPEAIPVTCEHAEIRGVLAEWAAEQGLGARWQPAGKPAPRGGPLAPEAHKGRPAAAPLGGDAVGDEDSGDEQAAALDGAAVRRLLGGPEVRRPGGALAVAWRAAGAAAAGAAAAGVWVRMMWGSV
jgi:hypothetical protein